VVNPSYRRCCASEGRAVVDRIELSRGHGGHNSQARRRMRIDGIWGSAKDVVGPDYYFGLFSIDR